MNFQSIKPIEDHKFFLDLAFRRAREKGKALRTQKLKGGRLEKSKHIELMKLQVIADTLASRMISIGKSFPVLDDLPEFYNHLVKLSLDYAQLKKSLAAINWLRKKVMELFRIYKSKISKTRHFERINPLKREFLGRISSVLKQVKDDFVFLEKARKVLKGFPVVKTSLKTAAITGFPNVGKTTLLYKLSGSRPEINTYPFTTRGINVAYLGKGKQRIQLLDTPGTLNRLEKMNNIERIAYLATKLCSQLIVYVFDLTEEYPLDKQAKLYDKLADEFHQDMIIYLSKTDSIPKKKVEAFKKEYLSSISDPEILKKELEKRLM
jgi:nucleolar GTP-binding protein